jgi:uncharacterized protein (TIGR03032 family)
MDTPTQQVANPASEAAATRYSISPGLVAFLQSNDLAIGFTSYQSGRLYLLGRNPKGGLMVNEQDFRKAMGLHVSGKSLYLATLAHIYRLENCLRPDQWMDETFTECFLPRTGHFTGALDAHDVGVTDDGTIIFVNTRFNCLATPGREHAFKQYWRPFFVTKLVDEDRCHLNGLAMDGGKPRYVTAVCRSDTIDAWRDRRADGGIVMDVDENSIVCEGLSMPHSPRMHRGKLWVLNSGTGELGTVDTVGKRFEPVVFCPGFVRGLAFHGRYAFVGLSRPRYQRFEGLELDQRLKAADSEPWTGIQIIDLDKGTCVQWFRIDGPVAELYDVAVLPGVGCAKSVGFSTDEALGIITIEE